ncbi:CLUMA_CG001066, isoform A [Clunio marinus]|uniref:CLUMA_CG001066, isoform A n=1 Tax=Clunio marinus TaxID=568069 RepID=A0A1J1HGX1_9DIPT|nr:CLUMA_CG001066, isoform A [Clunio marinus]
MKPNGKIFVSKKLHMNSYKDESLISFIDPIDSAPLTRTIDSTSLTRPIDPIPLSMELFGLFQMFQRIKLLTYQEGCGKDYLELNMMLIIF